MPGAVLRSGEIALNKEKTQLPALMEFTIWRMSGWAWGCRETDEEAAVMIRARDDCDSDQGADHGGGEK